MPGVRAVAVEGVPVALGEADDVQPVASPAFAVVLALQQAIDQCGVGGRGVFLVLGDKPLPTSSGSGGRPIRPNTRAG